MRLLRALVALVLAGPCAAAQDLSSSAYLEGFGKDTTGGQGGSTCTVSSTGSGTGAGTLWACLCGQSNRTVQFSVASAGLPDNCFLGSNLTVDGCLNGQSGVTITQNNSFRTELVCESPSCTGNIILRCLAFRGAFVQGGAAELEQDLVAFDGTSGTDITDVVVDRCTFSNATDGALDITGDVTDVTVQRSLFHGHSHANLVKYGTRARISYHHNVMTRSGERNPQVKGAITAFDYVSNVNYLHDVAEYPDGGATEPYGLRWWACTGTCASADGTAAGSPTGNTVASAFVGTAASLQLDSEGAGASTSGVYIAPRVSSNPQGSENYCSPIGNCAAAQGTPVSTSGYEVTVTPVNRMWQLLLPYVGSPTRTATDQTYLEAIAAVLPQAASIGVLHRRALGKLVLP